MLRVALVLMGLLVYGAARAQVPVVWVASPWEHVLKSTEPGAGRTVEITAAANEYEPFRIIVRAGEATLQEVNVAASDLNGAAGQIPAQNVALFREHYLNIYEPSLRSTAPTGWYPDALVPFINPEDGSELSGAQYDAVPFMVEAGANQGIWADVYVPPDVAAGEYTGTVTVTAEGRTLAEVPVKLTVWGFALPDTIAMRSNFGSLGGRVAKAAGLDAGSQEFREVEGLYIDAMLEHRCIPSSLGNVLPTWSEEGGVDDTETGEQLRVMVEEKHVNSLNLPFRYRDDPEKCKAYLRALAAYLREKGWLDLAYIYLEDEPNNAEQYETVRQQGALIREADPGIKRMCTEQTVTSNPEWGVLYGAVDIWCPLWGLWDEETARQRLALGEELWSYTALCQRDERTPFWQIDFPPLVYRAPFWVSWHYDITGFLYWSSVYWDPEKDPWTLPHFRDKFWGEGMLLYPGQPAGIRGPVTSIRLKLIREAMEDYEYMVLAAQKAGDQAVDPIVDAVATSFQEWSRVPDEYFTARSALAQLIAGAE